MHPTWQDIIVWIIVGSLLLWLLWRGYGRLSGRRPSSGGCASCGVRECPHRQVKTGVPRQCGGKQQPEDSTHGCPPR